MQRDIPGELAVLARELSNVELILSPPLGADERLVEVMVKRIMATGCCLQEKARHQVQEKSRRRLQVRPGTGAASAIVKESFALIDELLGVTDTDEPEYQIRRRVIHATGDLSLGSLLKLSPAAISAGVEAIRVKANILCDVKMVAAGIEPTAARLGIRVECAIADEATAQRALAGGITRSAAGMQRLVQRYGLDGALVVIGNAPTALFEVLRLAQEKGARPALVIGVPVGFIGAAESKDALSKSGLPYITLPGNRGGSSIAAAITNAMMKLSGRQPSDGADALRQG
jgi:precorrin-8X/cobalt-precorrin-8 methylmutase